METQKLYLEAIQERFKANAIVESIEEKIKSIAEKKTFEKYKSTPLFNDGMEFELIGVSSDIYTFSSDIEVKHIHVQLAYFCKSKLPKVKREKLEQVKEKYKKRKILDFCEYKIQLWKGLCYELEIEQVLSGNINLLIE